MAIEEFVIKVINEAGVGVAGGTTGRGGVGTNTNAALQAERQYARAMLQIDKARLATMSKGERGYWDEKKRIRNSEIGNAKNFSATQKANLKQSLNEQLTLEQQRYQKSISLATNFSSTMKSVLQRAVLYTAIYKGISAVTESIREWIDVNIELDYALAKVNTISEVSITQFARLQDMSLESGRGIVDMANALYEINSANIKGADAMRVLEVANRASVGGFVDAKDAADTLTDVLNAYHLSVSQTEMVSDKLLKAVEIGKVKWEEYHGVLGRVLPLANNLGVGLDELLGTLSTLTLSGLKFREAVVGMRNVFTKILKPTKDMDKVLADMNMNFGETFGSIQDVIRAKGVIPTLQSMSAVLDENNMETTDLFNNVRGLVAQLSLMSDGGKKAEEVIAQIGQSAGTTNEKAAIMADTIQNAQARMGAMWAALGVDLFTFGDRMKIVINIVTKTISLLRSIAPILKGIIAALGILALGISVMLANWLRVNYILPITTVLLETLGWKSRKVAVDLGVQAIATEGVTVATEAATIAMSAFALATTLVTIGIAAVVAAYTMTSSWIKKNEAEAAKLAQTNKEMIETFRNAKKEADLLSRTRPFEGMSMQELTRQNNENNKILEKRELLLKQIALNEQWIAKKQESGQKVTAENYAFLQKLKNELYFIQGLNGRNLEVYKAISDELQFQQLKLSNAAVYTNEIALGLKVTQDSLGKMNISQLEDGIDAIQKKIKALRETPDQVIVGGGLAKGMGLDKQSLDNLLASYDVFMKALKAAQNQQALIEDADRAKAIAKAKKANEEKLKFVQKFTDDYLKLSLAGRIRIIENQRKESLDEAKELKVSAENILYINEFYDREIEKEKEESHKKILSETEQYLKEVEKQNELIFKYNEEMTKKAEELRKTDFDKRNKALSQASEIRRQYLITDQERLKEDYDIQLTLLQNSNAWKLFTEQQQKTILEQMEREHNIRLTQIKYDEWKKQYELQAALLGSIEGIYEESLNIMILSTANAMDKLKAVWMNIYQTIVKILIKMIAKMAVVATLKAFISGATFDSSWFNGLMGALNMIEGKGVQDAIVSGGTITPYRKDDVVVIGTNLFGTRSGGTSNKGVEGKLDAVVDVLERLTGITMAKQTVFNVDPIRPEDINTMNEKGKRINRTVGYASN